MAKSTGAGLLLAILVSVGVAQCGRSSDTFGGSPDRLGLADLLGWVGQQMSMSGADVLTVLVDEGFWVGSGNGRVWVQIDTAIESLYGVDAGDSVNLTGRVVAHDSAFVAGVGPTGSDAQDLTRQGAHITVEVDDVDLSS